MAAWSADSPLGAAAIELADHIPELTKLLVGATAKLELEDGVAAVRAALAALTSVEFEAGVGADPTADDFDWVTVRSDQGMGRYLHDCVLVAWLCASILWWPMHRLLAASAATFFPAFQHV